MIEVQYPAPSFKMKKESGRDYLFDPIRKTWLLLTEEEWVRQNFVQYLIQQLHYPASLIALEKEIQLNELRKRFDILIYNRSHQPWMLVECKAPTIELSEATVQQILRYNLGVPVNYLIVTNGHYTYGWEKTNNSVSLLNQLPVMPQATQ